ncbi:hypothetical protein CEY04_01455 [Achromobacter sp. HZ28]|nr:hypothetical protein CEY05_01455 [Achromobacter sp. HZ34]OWT82005.1 hypothetical protein CEY04_01455 [Achromobacter sp. HZ28]
MPEGTANIGVPAGSSLSGIEIVDVKHDALPRVSRAVRLREWIYRCFPRFAAFVGIKRAQEQGRNELATALRDTEEMHRVTIKAYVCLVDQLASARKRLATVTSQRDEAQQQSRAWQAAYSNSWEGFLTAEIDQTTPLVAGMREADSKADAVPPDAALADAKGTAWDYAYLTFADSDDEEPMAFSEPEEAAPPVAHADPAPRMDESWHCMPVA